MAVARGDNIVGRISRRFRPLTDECGVQQWNDTDVREVWGAGRCGASVEWGAPTVLAATRARASVPNTVRESTAACACCEMR